MTTRTKYTMRAMLPMLATLLAIPAQAQRRGPSPDPRWQGWIGCWEPAGTASVAGLRGAAPSFALCVVPADDEPDGGSAVDVVTVVDGRAEHRERIDASGEARRSTVDGCRGWERAEWSADARRVLLSADRVCDGGMRVHSTGVIAISTRGEWLDVRGMSAGGGQPVVRVGRYRELTDSAGLPADVVAGLRGRAMFAAAARSTASEPVATPEVVEAARRVDAAVVEAWLSESGQSFAVNARQLVALADAKVPERVIDLMVALSYPRTFAVNRATRQAEPLPRPSPSDSGRTTTTVVRGWDPLGPGYDPNYGPYGQGRYNCGYGGYSCGYGYGAYPYGYGYGGYPYGNPYGWYGNQPVIIVVRPGGSGGSGGSGGGGSAGGGGRAVNGVGYTRDGGSSSGGGGGSEATPRQRTASPGGYSSGASGSRTSSSGGGSSSGGSSSSGSSGSSGRTAKPRNP